jgi:hypothetical protein
MALLFTTQQLTVLDAIIADVESNANTLRDVLNTIPVADRDHNAFMRAKQSHDQLKGAIQCMYGVKLANQDDYSNL